MPTPPPILVRTNEWTPRQKQVLDLLARGRTNSQIARELQISLDGAKWHVSEIITRLGVDTREEAADYWRAQNGMPSRFFSMVRGWIPPVSAGKLLAGTGAVGGAAIIAIAILLTWPSDERQVSNPPPAAGDATTVPVPTPVPPVGDGNVLSDGSNYTYRPALAYTAPDGSVCSRAAKGLVPRSRAISSTAASAGPRTVHESPA
jgi:DNA-binding CsgD family transcriptional regulator